MSSLESKKYWNKKIIEWEKSSYGGSSKELSFIEKVATRFRAPIKKRRKILLNLLKDMVKSKTVLELGCGSGDLCFEFLKLGATKVIGIDIAEVAIKAACEKAIAAKLQDKAVFFIKDIREDVSLPDADFVVGLGFIDYIDAETLKKLFACIKRRFIFSFPEKKKNLINILHFIYLKSQKCPTFYKFNREEFNNIDGMNGKCRFFSVNHMTFIANFTP